MMPLKNIVIILFAILFFTKPSFVLAKENYLEGYQKLTGPFKELGDYCKQNPPDDSKDEVCHADITWLSFPQNTFKKPFLDGRFFETGDKVTQTCSMGLKKNSGWYVLADVVDCHIWAGTLHINSFVKSTMLTNDILDVKLVQTSSYTDDGKKWIADKDKKISLTCKLDKTETVFCK